MFQIFTNWGVHDTARRTSSDQNFYELTFIHLSVIVRLICISQQMDRKYAKSQKLHTLILQLSIDLRVWSIERKMIDLKKEN